MEWEDFKQNQLIIVWFCLPLLMFSLSQTKCHWYVKPLYPALCIIIGWLLASVIKPSFPKKKFFTILFLSFLAVSEVLMVGVMIFKKHEAGLDHQILTQLNSNSYPKHASIYAVNWSQSQIFIAEVLKGLKPYFIPDIITFISRSKTNNLLLIPNDLSNQNFATQYQLKIIKKTRHGYWCENERSTFPRFLRIKLENIIGDLLRPVCGNIELPQNNLAIQN